MFIRHHHQAIQPSYPEEGIVYVSVFRHKPLFLSLTADKLLNHAEDLDIMTCWAVYAV